MATFTDKRPDWIGAHAALAADAGLDERDLHQLRPKHEVRPSRRGRFCILCGWRGPARRCCRCGGSTLAEEWPVRRRACGTPA
jgi:hypothetical protein